MPYSSLGTAQNIALLLSPTLIIVGVVVAVILGLLLLFRPFRLWYWKVDRHEDAIDSINRQIFEIRKDIKSQIKSEKAHGEIRTMKEKEGIQAEKIQKEISQIHEKPPEENGPLQIYIVPSEDIEANKLYMRDNNVDKKGRVYTREEIERLIQ